MNLKWNTELYRFEVEFQNFSSEQPLVKAAGFKTDGPPAWVWYSLKAAPLTKLRETKTPTTILTIASDARAHYTRLKDIEDKNAAVKAELAKHTKELKKKLKGDKQDAMKPDEYFDETIKCICIKVSPKPAPVIQSFQNIAPPPSTKCAICKDPIYDYEYPSGGPVICLWCGKIVLDTDDVI